MTLLSDLTDSAIVDNLKKRFDCDWIFTSELDIIKPSGKSIDTTKIIYLFEKWISQELYFLIECWFQILVRYWSQWIHSNRWNISLNVRWICTKERWVTIIDLPTFLAKLSTYLCKFHWSIEVLLKTIELCLFNRKICIEWCLISLSRFSSLRFTLKIIKVLSRPKYF